MSWSSQKKKRGLFVPFILSEGIFFKICVLTQGIYILLHIKKHYTLFLFVFKIVESLQCILNSTSFDHACTAWYPKLTKKLKDSCKLCKTNALDFA